MTLLPRAEAAGLRPEVRHLANSAGAILRPSSRFDLVRCGIAAYGLDPAPGISPDLGLVPAMTVRAPLALTKDLHAGASVSYGHTWTAPGDTRVGLVPLGYGDGVPRHAGNTAEVWVGGKRCPIRGRICMDQFVVDLGDRGGPASAGDEVVLFGPGTSGEPTADDWARACGTIHYEIVTRMGGRLHRRYVEAAGARSHRVSTPRKVLSVAGGLAAGAVGVAAAGTAYRVAKRRQVISRRGVGDDTPFGSLHSPADHGRHRRRRRPARRGRRVRRATAYTGGAGADGRVRPRLLPHPRLLALPARGLPGPGADGLLRPALPRPVRTVDPRPRHHRAARP